jgi:Transglycosylase-like domain
MAEDIIKIDIVPKLDEQATEQGVKKLTSEYKQGGEEISSHISSSVSKSLSHVADESTAAAGRISDKFSSAFTGAFSKVDSTSAQTFGRMRSEAEDAGSSAADHVSDAFDTAFSKIDDTEEKVFGKMYDSVTKVGDAMTDKFSAATGKVNELGAAIGDVKKKEDDAVQKIEDFSGKLKNVKVPDSIPSDLNEINSQLSNMTNTLTMLPGKLGGLAKGFAGILGAIGGAKGVWDMTNSLLGPIYGKVNDFLGTNLPTNDPLGAGVRAEWNDIFHHDQQRDKSGNTVPPGHHLDEHGNAVPDKTDEEKKKDQEKNASPWPLNLQDPDNIPWQRARDQGGNDSYWWNQQRQENQKKEQDKKDKEDQKLHDQVAKELDDFLFGITNENAKKEAEADKQAQRDADKAKREKDQADKQAQRDADKAKREADRDAKQAQRDADRDRQYGSGGGGGRGGRGGSGEGNEEGLLGSQKGAFGFGPFSVQWDNKQYAPGFGPDGMPLPSGAPKSADQNMDVHEIKADVLTYNGTSGTGGIPHGGGGAPGPGGIPGGGAGFDNGGIDLGGTGLYTDDAGTLHATDSSVEHLIQRESGGKNVVQGITDANSGGNEAQGYFQITPASWNAHGGGRFAPTPLGATPEQQFQIAQAIFRDNPSGSDWGAGLPGRESAAGLAGGFLGGSSGTPIGLGGGSPYSRASQVPIAPNVEAGIRAIGGLPPIYPTSGPGAYQVPEWSKQLGAQFGLTPSTYPGGGSLHQMGYAMDFTGSQEGMDAFSDYIQNNLASQTLQLIHADGNRKWGIASGQDVSGSGYYGADYAGHHDHVHWATDVPPPGFGYQGGPQLGSSGTPMGAGGPTKATLTGYGTPVPSPQLGGVATPPTQGNEYSPQNQQSLGSGKGFGVSGGGIIGAAEQAAVSAAGMAGFGAGGIAAQMAEQEINLAAQKTGQMMATAAMAPYETFHLGGGQMGAPTVGQGWYPKIVGSMMGQQNSLPNIAGATQKPADPKDDKDSQAPSGADQGGQKPKSGPSGAHDDPVHVQVKGGGAAPQSTGAAPVAGGTSTDPGMGAATSSAGLNAALGTMLA